VASELLVAAPPALVDASANAFRRAGGIAEALGYAERFVDGDRVVVVLADNIFERSIRSSVEKFAQQERGARILLTEMSDPAHLRHLGVPELDGNRVLRIVEKPDQPPSSYAVTGVYCYDETVFGVLPNLVPSARGELEITDVNKAYLAQDALACEVMGRGMAWLDTGTHESLLQASTFIETIELRQGLKVACIEEVAYHKGFITSGQLEALAHSLPNAYGQYLLDLLKG
jgi:glucose-1-phosphate thymidylyltransferase